MGHVAAQWEIDVDAAGDHRVVVNGDDITALVAGWAVTGRGRGQPPVLTVHAVADTHITGAGIVEVHQPATAADAHTELVELLAGLRDDVDALWSEAVGRRAAAGPGGPAGAFLDVIIDHLTGV